MVQIHEHIYKYYGLRLFLFLFCLFLIFAHLIVPSYAYDGEGTAVISPSTCIVGAFQDYQITFTAGAEGLVRGGFIQIDLPTCNTFHGLPSILNWSRPQISDNRADGFVSVNPANKFNVMIESMQHPLSGNFSYKIKLVSTCQILPGEVIFVLFKQVRSQRLMQSCFFPVRTDTDGDGMGKIISQSMNVNIVGGTSKHARIVIPSIVGVNDKFDVKVAVLDQFGFPCNNYIGTIHFKTLAPMQNFPESYTFLENENGIHLFKNVSFLNKGIFTINVSSPAINADSNPCVVMTRSPVSKLYWGDLHWHSNFSDGTRSPVEGYEYARNITFLDFTAMTDHDSFLSPRNLWTSAARLSHYLYEPGVFTTFSAYEWTSPSVLKGGFGHKNVYYLYDDEPLFPYTDPETSTPDSLWEHLKGRYAITIPHHVAEEDISVVDWSYYNDELQPLAEIYSTHGNSEWSGGMPPYFSGGVPGYYIQDALAMGHKLGFIASTDSHLTLPGGNEILASYRGHRHALPALAAIYAPSLKKGALLKQMKNRHTFATTGRRIVLLFNINNTAFMGDEVSTTQTPHISVVAIGGKSIIHKIEIIRDNETIFQMENKSSVVNMTFNDNEFPNFLLGSIHYYYARITLADSFSGDMPGGMQTFSHMAWSSPIWVTKE